MLDVFADSKKSVVVSDMTIKFGVVEDVGPFAPIAPLPPFGIGLGTVRACLRLLMGMNTGVKSAGNGAAMRAAIIGVYFADEKQKRLAWGRELAQVIHTDERAIDGAQFVAEVAALCMSLTDREEVLRKAAEVLRDESLHKAFQAAMELGATTPAEAGQKLGNSGFVMHSLALSTWCFWHHGERYLDGVHATIAAGGATDTHAAIVGGWLGAMHGAECIPRQLVNPKWGSSAAQVQGMGVQRLVALGDVQTTGDDQG